MNKRKPRGRQGQIENEREQLRKAYEENVRKKKEQLYFEFEKLEEVNKQSKVSIEKRNDIKFRQELDKVINYSNDKQEELNLLQKQLKDVLELKEFTKPIEPGIGSGSRLSTNNLTSIFSKKYYKSEGVEMLKVRESRNREDVFAYNIHLQEEVEEKEQNSKNEEQRNHQLSSQLDELFKTKQKLRFDVLELEALSETACKRFTDLDAVQYEAKERKKSVEKDLLKAKQSLKEYKDISSKYQEKQQSKMREEDKIKKTQEEIITHDMIRMDEMQREQMIQQETIRKESIQQKEIIKKRKESKFTLQFIEVFQILERLFCRGRVEEEEIEKLFDQNQNNQDFPFQTNEFEKEDKQGTIEEQQSSQQNDQTNFLETETKPKSSMIEGVSQMVNSKNGLTNSPESPNMHHNEEDNRLFFIQAINKFYFDHPKGAHDLVDQLFTIHQELEFRQKELSTSFNLLLHGKQKLNNDLAAFEEQLITIKKENAYIQEMIENPQVEEELMNVPEAFDSGIVALKDNIANSNGKQVKLSTINILRMENFATENEKIIEQVKTNQNFIFNFFSNYSESAVRLCQMIKLAHGVSGGISPQELDTMARQVIQFVKDTWEGKLEGSDNGDPSKGVQAKKQNKIQIKPSNNLQKLGSQEIEDIGGSNNGYFKRIQSDKYTQEEIRELFTSVFPNKVQDADKFYNLIKFERMIWAFCNVDQIKNYLNECKALNQKEEEEENHEKSLSRREEIAKEQKSVDSVFQNIDILKQQGVLIFEDRLRVLREFMVEILNKIQFQSRLALKVVQDANPDFNPKTRLKYLVLKDNDEIREAKNKVTQKKDNYFRSNEPLQEDFFILQGDKEQQQEGSGESDNEQGQIGQETNPDKINQLVEYIRKNKSIGKVLLLEQNKYNVKQMNKERKSHKEKSKYQKEEGTHSVSNSSPDPFDKKKSTYNIDPFSNILGQNSQQQSMNQIGLIPNSISMVPIEKNQQQQLINNNNIINNSLHSMSQQSHGGMNNTQDSMDNRSSVAFNIPPINQEELFKFKQMNSQEESNIIQERDRVHNLPKRLLLEQQRKLDFDKQNKKNKFFISNEMTKINQRLHEEKKDPLKEKQVKGFADNQNILSTINKMDKFGSYLGPQVFDLITNEKREIMKVVRGDLFQPELKYLQANQAYTTRKALVQEQRNIIAEHKLEQALQPGNQRPFFKSTHSIQKLVPKREGDINHVRSASEENEVTEDTKNKKSLQIKIPQYSDIQLQDIRPHTQGSNKRSFNQLTGSRNQSGSRSSKGIKQPFRMNSTSANNNFMFNDILTTDNSQFTSYDPVFNSPNNIYSPYSTQNLRFYERYTSPQGNAFFDSILNIPNRPFTQKPQNRHHKLLEQNIKNDIPSISSPQLQQKRSLPIDLAAVNVQKSGLHYQTSPQKPESINIAQENDEQEEEKESGQFGNTSQRFYELGSSPSSSARTAFTSNRTTKNQNKNKSSNIHNKQN